MEQVVLMLPLNYLYIYKSDTGRIQVRENFYDLVYFKKNSLICAENMLETFKSVWRKTFVPE